MKGKKNLLILFSCVLTVIIAGLFACTRSAKEIIPSSEYAPYVNAYTGGVISQSSPHTNRTDSRSTNGRP